MIPICLVSIWLWVLILLKADWVWRANKCRISLADAINYLKVSSHHPDVTSPRAKALNHFVATTRICDVKERNSAHYFLEVAIRRQTGPINRFIPAIITLAAVAPLLGLFGTVSGMVETFRIIGMYGMGNAQAMASGIKEAMITTQTGLLVAIPGIFIGQMLRKKATSIQRDLLVFQRGLSQWIEKEYGK